MRISDERYSRDLRRLQLAVRMTRLSARTRHIALWTGLTAHRVRCMQARSLGLDLHDTALRPRGASPYGVVRLLDTAQRRGEAAIFLLISDHYEVLPAERGASAAKALPTVVRGERLCAAFETFQQLLPQSSLSMEKAMLVLSAFVRDEEVDLVRCRGCEGWLLLHRRRLDRVRCANCLQPKRQMLSLECVESASPLAESSVAEPVQGCLF
jgi:hypothetical protein